MGESLAAVQQNPDLRATHSCLCLGVFMYFGHLLLAAPGLVLSCISPYADALWLGWWLNVAFGKGGGHEPDGRTAVGTAFASWQRSIGMGGALLPLMSYQLCKAPPFT
jgi:hypothetical protein